MREPSCSQARVRRSRLVPTWSGCAPRSSCRRRRTSPDALRLRAMLDAIDGCPAPVVARVQGHALGGGVGLVACCDIVIAEPAAQFAFSEVKLGIVPAVISPFALAKIGPSAARRLFVTGERFGADVALRIGLVHEVTGELDVAVERVVGELLSRARPPRAAQRSSPARRSAQTRPHGESRRTERATRARKACARSSRSARRPGARHRRPDTELGSPSFSICQRVQRRVQNLAAPRSLP